MGLPHHQFQNPHNFEDALAQAAALCSVDLSYWDVFHKEHKVSIEAIRSILRSLGWDVTSYESICGELLRRYEAELRQPLRKTNVVSESVRQLTLTLPENAAGPLALHFALESGAEFNSQPEIQSLEPLWSQSSNTFQAKVYRLPIPEEVPLGYHQLQLALNGTGLGSFHVIVCPDRAYLPDNLAAGGRTAGFNVTLYGLRSQRNWGSGDFTDLKKLLEWAHNEVGFSFIGVNPLHALHNRVPYNASPYLPLSIYYKNHLYIDIEDVPEFKTSRCAQALRNSEKIEARIRAAREAEFVAYHDIDVLKNGFLKLLYREFKRSACAGRAQAFREFCQREGDLLNKYALYRALDQILHKQDRNRWTWLDWPAEYRNPDSEACHQFARQHQRTVEYFKYVQFVLEEQLTEAQAHAKAIGMSIGLYHDLAVATDSCGSELWAHGNFFVKGCRVGAPPDEFSPKGQDWSFPPPNAEAHSEDGYHLYRESIRKIVRTGGALRLDHVMRLFRLFWIPEGMQAAQGAYVRDRANDLMSILALESVRSRNLIIGEDLGTVTDEIRNLLAKYRILSYRIFSFERSRHTGFVPSADYPRQALVGSATHDLATLTGFWLYRDVEARRSAGLLDDASYWGQRHDREADKQWMLDILHREGLIPPHTERDATKIEQVEGDLHNGIVGFLAKVPSMLLLLNQEDLTKETEQQNLPGSTSEYPNWQRKMKVQIEDLDGPEMKPYAAMVRDQLKRNQRA